MIVVVSKPPAPAVAERLVSRLEKIAADGTPVVACLLGLDDSDGSVAVRGTLEGEAGWPGSRPAGRRRCRPG